MTPVKASRKDRPVPVRPSRRRSTRAAISMVPESLEGRQLLAAVVVPDAYQVIQDSLLSVSSSGVLANDQIASGNPLTITANTTPTHGSLVLNPTGTFTYVPNPGYVGPDQFNYTATDAQNNANSTTVTLNVLPSVSQATVTAGTRLANVDTTQSALLNGLLGNLLGGAALNLSVVDNNALAQGQVNGGELLAALQTNLGLATTDQALTTNITLSQLFTAAADVAQAGGDTALVTALNNLALQVTGITQPIQLGDLVNVTPNQGDFADASLNALDLATGGIQLFNYQNVATTTTPVTISGATLGLDSVINGVAISARVVEPPVFVVGGVGTTFRTAGIRLKTNIDLVDISPSTAGLNSALVGLLGPLVTVNSTLTLADLDLYTTVASGTGTITAIDAISRAVTLDATPGVANVYLGTIGDAIFGDRTAIINPLTDVGFGSIGSLAINTTGLITTGGTVAIQAKSSALGTAPLTSTLTFNPPYPETQVSGSSAAFLSNLASTLVSNLQVQTSGTLGGVLDPLVNGTILPLVQPLVVNALAPTLGAVLTGVVDPVLAAIGVGIGQEVVTVAAQGQAAPPAANPDFATTATNAAVNVPVLLNDARVAGDVIAITGLTQPTNGTVTINADGTLTYTPAANFVGADTFTYTITGRNGTSSATVTLAVNAANTPPTALPDSYTVTQGTPLTVALPGVLGNDTDLEGNPLTAVLASNPTNGALTLNANGSFLYIPNAGFVGVDTFTYQASDGTALSNPVTVTVTVTAANQTPVANPDTYTIATGSTLTIPGPGVLGNDTDPNGDPLTAVLVTGPTNGTLTLNSNGSFSYVPTPGFIGTDTFTYRASDGTNLSNPVLVTVAVTPVNRAPAALPDVYSVVQGTTLTIPGPGVLANDADPDGNPLTAVLGSGPANGTLTLNADGSFSYTPNAGFVGTDSFTYRASDGTDTSPLVAVTLEVTAAPVNQIPVAITDTYTIPTGSTLTISAPGVLGNDVSPGGLPLTAVLANGPSNGTLTLNPNGSFTYTPNAGFVGIDSFTYRASDGTNQSLPVAVTLAVTNVNGAPVALPDFYNGPSGTPLVITGPGVLGNDFDPNGDPLTAILVTGPAHGSVTLNPDGSFVFVPAPGYVGPDSFTYRASDGASLSSVITVSLAIQAVVPVGPAPTVTAAARFGFHAQPTSFVIQFNTDLDPASAADVSHYNLVSPGRDRRIGTRDDKRIAIQSATYDAATRTVTLIPVNRRLDLYSQYQLTVVGSGPNPLRNANGLPLDGNGDGIGGDNQVIRINQLGLAGRANTPLAQRVPLVQQIPLVRIGQASSSLFAARGRLFQSLRRLF